MNWNAETKNIRASVQDMGAMVTAKFQIGNRWVSPLYVPHWHDQHIENSFLQHMKGDFFCVPFGQDGGSQILNPEPWRGSNTDDALDRYIHGYSCNGKYTLVEKSNSMLHVRLEYPLCAVQYTEREIRCSDESLFIIDRVAMREDARLPIGIHPIFALSHQPEQSILCPPPCAQIESYPFPPEKTSRILPGQSFSSLKQAPLAANDFGDFHLLPSRIDSEELIFFANIREGIVSLDHLDENYRVSLRWDREAYQNCLLWISNRGRDAAPWDGKNCCLGIEPVTSCFDFGRTISAASNPLSHKQTTTALDLKAGEHYEWWHEITVEAL